MGGDGSLADTGGGRQWLFSDFHAHLFIRIWWRPEGESYYIALFLNTQRVCMYVCMYWVQQIQWLTDNTRIK